MISWLLIKKNPNQSQLTPIAHSNICIQTSILQLDNQYVQIIIKQNFFPNQGNLDPNFKFSLVYPIAIFLISNKPISLKA